MSHAAASHISNIMRVTADGLHLPRDWNPAEWNRALIVGSGLSALAARATLSQARLKRNVHQDPYRVRRMLRARDARLIGVSMSGTSAEVKVSLALARQADRPYACLTAAKGDDAAISLPPTDAPPALRHLAICVALGRLMGIEVSLADVQECPRLAHVLDESMQRELTPIIVAERGSFEGELLTAYWREFLHQPAVHLTHPDWTHDFLWAFVRARPPATCFVAIPPRRDLPDARLARVVDHLRGEGAVVYVMDRSPRRTNAVQRLADVAATFHGAATRANRDLDTELSLSGALPS